MNQHYEHPYFPKQLELPNYQSNKRSMIYLLSVVSTIFSFIVLATILIVRTYRRQLTLYKDNNNTSTKQNAPVTSILYNFTWFVLCGILHCGFEAYWIYHRHNIVGRSDLLAELWKEYSKGDSRYVSCDTLLLTLEIITVFIWGPLCFLAAYHWFFNHPQYRLYQFTVSIGHLYSCSLYFIMDTFTGFVNCNPHPFYFWVYFVGFNSPWIILPLSYIINNGRFITNNLLNEKRNHLNNNSDNNNNNKNK
ncbi:Emopamil binding protein-domain-containing protein [Cunninghamella echinulata]|nr:Emopamil binding protein-domain-containing protein [Cunninghamella echinulata]